MYLMPVYPQAHHCIFILTQSSLLLSSISNISLSYTLSLSCLFLPVSLPLSAAYLCFLSLSRSTVFWPQSELIVGYGWRQTIGPGSWSSWQCCPPQVLYNTGKKMAMFFLLLFVIPYVTTHSCVQVSQHSADQHESVLSATLHQCHSEKLPQGRTWVIMPYRHCLLSGYVSLSRFKWHNLRYSHLPFSHIHSLNLPRVL